MRATDPIARTLGCCLAVALLLPAAGAFAQTPAPAPTPPPTGDAAAAPTPPPPPPYSLPWQLRPSQPANVVRLDTTLDFVGGTDATTMGSAPDDGFSMAMMLLGAYKVIPQLSLVARLGMVTYSADPEPGGTSAFLNPVLGAIYGITIAEQFRLAFWLGVTAPVGTGGGDDPDEGVWDANRAGFRNRAMMDNAMFAVNYFTVFPGVDFAWVAHGLTVQAEVTLLQLFRVRGPDCNLRTVADCEMAQAAGMGSWALDDTRTNLTLGLHVGYFVIPQLSFGAEIRHQQWLAVEDQISDAAAAQQTSFSVGVRGHIKLSPTMVLRPGVAYSMGIDAPMGSDEASATPLNRGFRDHIVQIDIPFNF